MCVVRNRKTNGHSTTRDSSGNTVLGLNNKLTMTTKNLSTGITLAGLSNNNLKHFKTPNNTILNINENGKATVPIESNNLEEKSPNKYIKSFRAIKRPNDNMKEELTQGNDSIHFLTSLKKQDLSECQKLDGLLENTQGTGKVGILEEDSFSENKKNKQINYVDNEGDEPYEVVQDATVLNEDDTLYGIEKIMPEFHL
uniref:Uncharacterized protein n=1 Tax=Strongyloides stercoralis TaxID=6248 RepID=A0A0K0DTE6_STRER